MYVKANSLISIIWLLESVSLCPKVIPISGFPCISTKINDLCLASQTNSKAIVKRYTFLANAVTHRKKQTLYSFLARQTKGQSVISHWQLVLQSQPSRGAVEWVGRNGGPQPLPVSRVWKLGKHCNLPPGKGVLRRSSNLQKNWQREMFRHAQRPPWKGYHTIITSKMFWSDPSFAINLVPPF